MYPLEKPETKNHTEIVAEKARQDRIIQACKRNHKNPLVVHQRKLSADGSKTVALTYRYYTDRFWLMPLYKYLPFGLGKKLIRHYISFRVLLKYRQGDSYTAKSDSTDEQLQVLMDKLESELL